MATLISSNTIQDKSTILGDAITGAVAGTLGVGVLDQVANFLYNREDSAALAREKFARQEIGSDEVGPASLAARKINQKLKLDLTPKQTDRLSSVIHYGLGTVPGAFYGVLIGRYKKISVGHGFLYGLGLSLINDELMSVQLGLANKPSRYPWQAHARGLAAHVALGMVTYWGIQAFSKAFRC